jgi:hypothetical protein
MSLDPAMIRQGLELGVLDRTAALDYLRGPARPIWLKPATPPPPERLALVRVNGRIRKPRQKFTEALIAAHVVDADVVKRRSPDHPERSTR